MVGHTSNFHKQQSKLSGSIRINYLPKLLEFDKDEIFWNWWIKRIISAFIRIVKAKVKYQIQVALRMHSHHLIWCGLYYLYCYFLLCSKNAQCDVVYHNNSMFWRLCAKMDHPLYLDTTPMWHHHLRVLSFLLDISRIKRTITYSIVKSFIGIVSKAVMKCLYEADKLLSKVMITPLNVHSCTWQHQI